MKLTLPKGHALIVDEEGARHACFGPARYDEGYLAIDGKERFEYESGRDTYAILGDDGTIYGCCHVVAEAADPWDLPLPASLALVDAKDLRRSAMTACMPIMEYAQEQDGDADLMHDFTYLLGIWGKLPYVYPHLHGRTGREAQDALVAEYLAERKRNLAMMQGQTQAILGRLLP